MTKQLTTEERKLLKEEFERDGFSIEFFSDHLIISREGVRKKITNLAITKLLRQGINIIRVSSELKFKGIGTPPE